MTRNSFDLIRWVAIALLAICHTNPLHAAQKKTAAPGYRPESELADLFLSRLNKATLSVYPTLVRTRQGTGTSEASQELIVRYAKENQWGHPKTAPLKPPFPELKGKFQFDVFNNVLEDLGPLVQKPAGDDYALILELLVTPTPSGAKAIGGIHIYVLDAKGRNAFSFLLNSHHDIFTEAHLSTTDPSNQGLEALVKKGTETALSALRQQLDAAGKNR